MHNRSTLIAPVLSLHSSPFTLYSLFFTLLLVSCGNDGNHFTIDGEIEGMESGELYIYNLESSTANIDTIPLRDGEFFYESTVDEPTAYTLVFPNAVEQVIFAEAGLAMKYKASANDLKNYTVNGGSDNKLMNGFRKKVKKLDAAATRKAAEEFIDKHLNSLASIYLFDRYFLQDPSADTAKMKKLLKKLKHAQPRNLLLFKAEGALAASEKFKLGAKAPKIKVATLYGDSLDMAHLRRERTLLVFWSSWMQGSWIMMQELRALQREHSKNDSLSIVSVSLDTQQFKYTDLIERDSTGIIHICDCKAWRSPLVSAFGVRDLPSYIILNKKGVVTHLGTDREQMKQDCK